MPSEQPPTHVSPDCSGCSRDDAENPLRRESHVPKSEVAKPSSPHPFLPEKECVAKIPF